MRRTPYVIQSVREKDLTPGAHINAQFGAATDQQEALMKRAARQVAEK